MEQRVSTNERLKDGGGNARKTATDESTKIMCRLLASAKATCTLSGVEKTPFHSCTLYWVVARVLVEPPEVMNPKREVFWSKTLADAEEASRDREETSSRSNASD